MVHKHASNGRQAGPRSADLHRAWKSDDVRAADVGSEKHGQINTCILSPWRMCSSRWLRSNS